MNPKLFGGSIGQQRIRHCFHAISKKFALCQKIRDGLSSPAHSMCKLLLICLLAANLFPALLGATLAPWFRCSWKQSHTAPTYRNSSIRLRWRYRRPGLPHLPRKIKKEVWKRTAVIDQSTWPSLLFDVRKAPWALPRQPESCQLAGKAALSHWLLRLKT